jgi:hypothetical protein
MIELAKTSITEGFDVDNCFAYYEFWLILFGMIAALMTETHLLNMAMAHYEMLYGTYTHFPQRHWRFIGCLFVRLFTDALTAYWLPAPGRRHTFKRQQPFMLSAAYLATLLPMSPPHGDRDSFVVGSKAY